MIPAAKLLRVPTIESVLSLAGGLTLGVFVCSIGISVKNGIEYVRDAFVRMNGTVQGVKVQSCLFEGQRDLFSDDERTFGSQCDLKFRVSRD